MTHRYILQIDTSTPVCSVALSCDGISVAQADAGQSNMHASQLTLLCKQLLDEQGIHLHQLAAVAVAKGPGSYTGLRIGVSVAKGICYAAELPLIAIDSLHSLAAHYRDTYAADIASHTLLCPMIDARRMEVYMALYSPQIELVQPTAARIMDAQSFEDLPKDQEVHLFGSGADKLTELFASHARVRVVPGLLASAGAMSSLAHRAWQQGQVEDLAYFEPYYLKDFIPTTPKSRLKI